VSLWAVAHLSLLTGVTNVVVNSVDLVVANDRISNCYKNVFFLSTKYGYSPPPPHAFAIHHSRMLLSYIQVLTYKKTDTGR
jgi:hypothetical protein